MAAITLGNIPSHINTYERLLVWAAMCCQSIANGQQVNVLENQGQQPQVQVQVYRTADNVDRFIVSAYMPVVTADLNSSTEKTWMAAAEIGSAAPHTNLLSN
jgi:hypothetical protein